MRVTKLMLEVGIGWNKPLIWEVFFEEDAQTICATLVARYHTTNCIVWHYEKQGSYTIRSGYYLTREIKRGCTQFGKLSWELWRKWNKHLNENIDQSPKEVVDFRITFYLPLVRLFTNPQWCRRIHRLNVGDDRGTCIGWRTSAILDVVEANHIEAYAARAMAEVAASFA
ncbi:hypothetical protein Salat_1140100 [Sesamum alatum]|uniref:Uncharacterized protein n=1 Tax=Sesamum alatum TaxID=300844 RepID=A0AAE2CN89_9LAMI|nr:hypothetical protein Salat_1140100 [Sesamum alatum]